jgi:hypothetical protein
VVYALLGLVLCMFGFAIARYGVGAGARSADGDSAGLSPAGWKLVGGLLVAVGIVVAAVGLLR